MPTKVGSKSRVTGLIRSIRLKVHPRPRVMVNMADSGVEVACPHCGGRINLGTNASGAFDCPLCHERFEWGSPGLPPDVLSERGFWVSGIAPFLIALLGVVLTLVFAGDNWGALGWLFYSLLAWPVVALIIGIYGYVTARFPLMIGGLLSLVVSVGLYLLFWAFSW